MGKTAGIRQGDLLPALVAQATTETGVVDLTQFVGGITFRMVCGSTVVTGPATGDASGNLTYNWNSGDTNVAGTYSAVFIGTDGTGKTETFPTGSNLTVIVVPRI